MPKSDAESVPTLSTQSLLGSKCPKPRTKSSRTFKNVSSFILYNIGHIGARSQGQLHSQVNRNLDKTKKMNPYRSQQQQHQQRDYQGRFPQQPQQRYPAYAMWESHLG